MAVLFVGHSGKDDAHATALEQWLVTHVFTDLFINHGDDDADAALFYGPIARFAHSLEELRQVRVVRDRRPLVMLGASGAGAVLRGKG
jgi:hypothetical protein